MPVDDIDHTKLMSGSIWKLELETGMLLEEKKIPHVTNMIYFFLTFEPDSFNNYVLITYYMPGKAVGRRDVAVTSKQGPCPHRAFILMEEM